jgi:hypothetical protein
MTICSLRTAVRRLSHEDSNGHRCPRCRCAFAVSDLDRIRDRILDKVVAALPADPFAVVARQEERDATFAEAVCPHCGELLGDLLDFDNSDAIVYAVQRDSSAAGTSKREARR